jgi:ABC-type glycerol-3-phosphate transport system substrate-binding protein
MTSRIASLAVLSLFVAVFMSAPARLHGQQPSQAQHEQHHPDTAAQPAQAAGDQRATMMSMMATMHANDQKLDALVKKMNAATGNAKVDAIAELLTTLVQDRKTMHESMSSMSMMMNMMGSMHGRGDSDAAPKK